MPRDSRARTRAARARMAATGQTYTEALAALTGPPGMERDEQAAPAMAALMFAEVMVTGKRAAEAAGDDLAAATAAVRAAITPMWPQLVPEVARDVLMTSARLTVARGVTELPAGTEDPTAATTLELTATWVAAGSPDPGGRGGPPSAWASSVAFDRDEEPELLAAVCLLLALAHPPAPARDDDRDDFDSFYDPAYCPECGADLDAGEYSYACDGCG